MRILSAADVREFAGGYIQFAFHFTLPHASGMNRTGYGLSVLVQRESSKQKTTRLTS
ncbi:MAG: hypothetical protein ACSHYB_01835 [Roseibacillus sp.]